jgi:hypothetical protein
MRDSFYDAEEFELDDDGLARPFAFPFRFRFRPRFALRALLALSSRARTHAPPQEASSSEVSSEEEEGGGASFRRQPSIFGDMLRSLSERFGEDPLDYDSDDEPRIPMAQRPLVGATLRASAAQQQQRRAAPCCERCALTLHCCAPRRPHQRAGGEPRVLGGAGCAHVHDPGRELHAR